MKVVDPELMATSLLFVFPAWAAYTRKKWPAFICCMGVAIFSFLYHIDRSELIAVPDKFFGFAFTVVGPFYSFYLGPCAFTMSSLQFVMGYYIYTMPDHAEFRDTLLHMFYHTTGALQGYMVVSELIHG
jgi:hypothetical protein